MILYFVVTVRRITIVQTPLQDKYYGMVHSRSTVIGNNGVHKRWTIGLLKKYRRKTFWLIRKFRCTRKRSFFFLFVCSLRSIKSWSNAKAFLEKTRARLKSRDPWGPRGNNLWCQEGWNLQNHSSSCRRGHDRDVQDERLRCSFSRTEPVYFITRCVLYFSLQLSRVVTRFSVINPINQPPTTTYYGISAITVMTYRYNVYRYRTKSILKIIIWPLRGLLVRPNARRTRRTFKFITRIRTADTYNNRVLWFMK